MDIADDQDEISKLVFALILSHEQLDAVVAGSFMLVATVVVRLATMTIRLRLIWG